MIEKAEVKKAILHSAGCDADDWLEKARKNASAFEGAKQALAKAAKDVQALVAVVQQDLKDNKFDGLEPSEIADYAILQITRACDALGNTSVHYNNRQISAQGEIAAYEKLVGYFRGLHEAEDLRIQRFKEAIASGEILIEEDGEPVSQGGNGRIAGVRPGASLAAQRRAEDAAAVEGEPEPEKAEAAPEEPEKPKRKRRKRKTKKDETGKDAQDS